MRSADFLNVYYFNAQSLGCKLNELSQLLHSDIYDVISVSETWFKECDVNSLILDGANYDVLRNDRRSGNKNGGTKVGGGVCIFIRSSIKYKTVSVSERGHGDIIDFVCADITGFENNYRLMNCYIPPVSCGLSISILENFLKSIEDLFVCNSSIIMFGDFNLPGIIWSQLNCAPLEYHGSVDATFAEFVMQHALQQLVHAPTRGNNILDLVFSDDPYSVCNLEITQPFSSSDHNAITFQLFCGVAFCDVSQSNRNAFTPPKYCFRKANWEGISDALESVDWRNLLFNNSVDKLWEAFYDTLFSIIDKFVPKACDGRTKSKRKCYPKPIRNLQNRKLIIWKKWQADRNNMTLKYKYVDITKQCRMAIHDYNANKEKSLIETDNLGRFYKYVNRKLAVKTGIGILKNGTGGNVIEPSKQAEMLSNYFATTFVDDNGILPNFSPKVSQDASLAYITFTAGDVYKKLNKLRVDFAGGPDGLQPIFL